MRVLNTNTVNPEQGHGKMSLQDRNSIPIAPENINMGMGTLLQQNGANLLWF